MKKLFLITMLAALGFSINAAADVKTFPYPYSINGEEPLADMEVEKAGEVKAAEVNEEAQTNAVALEDQPGWDNTRKELKKKKSLKGKEQRLDKIRDKAADGFEKLYSSLEQLSIDLKFKAKVEILDGLDITGKYLYEAEPAFYGDYFSRLDGYSAGLKIKFLELFGLDTKFGISASPELEVRFYRFFDTLKEARWSKPYTLKNMPFTAEDAINKLNPGDLVAFDGELNMAYGYNSVLSKIADWVKLNISGGGAMLGRLRMFIFRADDNIVRLRVSALRSAPKSIRAKLSVFDLFDLGWSKLTELVEKALNLDELFEAELRKVDQDLFLADYTLDLKDPRVRSAYDHVFDRERRYRTVADTAFPFTSEQELRNVLWDRLQPINDIAVGDQDKAKPAAVANFMGSNFSNGGFFEVKAGIRGAWRGESRRVKQDNRLKQTFFDADGNPFYKHYFFPSWLKRTEKSAGVTLNREKKHQASNIIYTATDDGKYDIVNFESIGFYNEETDKRYDGDEHERILQKYRRVLPPSSYRRFYNHLEENGWGSYSDDYRQNVRISARYFITEKGLKLVEGARSSEIQKHVVAALHEMDMETKVFGYAGKVGGRQVCNLKKLRKMGVRTWKPLGRKKMKTNKRGEWLGEHTLKYCKKISGVSKKLAAALNPNLTAKQRHKKFSSFTRSSLFRKIGAGIIFDIIGGRDINEDASYFEFVINASGQKEPVRFTDGKIENRPLYEIILQMERILNDDHPDLRLPGDEESIIRKKMDNLGQFQTI